MELDDMKKKDILNPALIGNGIPDLQDELDKINAEGSQEQSQDEDIFGFGGSNNQDEDIFGGSNNQDEDIFGGNNNQGEDLFGGSDQGDDIFGFNKKKDSED